MISAQTGGLVVVLAPMRSELRPLVRALPLRRFGTGDPGLLRCAFGGGELLATTTGIGTRAAARKTEVVLDSGPVDHIVVVGIAGGIGPSVDIGDLVVPELVIDLSTGAEYRPGILGAREPRGSLATSDELIVDQGEVARLERRGVIAIDMETAAIAAVCERRGCPWSVFRAISDRADDGSADPAVFALAGPDGEPRFRSVLRFVLTKPKSIPRLVRLARGASLATKVAASAALAALGETHAA